MRILAISYSSTTADSARFYQALGLTLNGDVNDSWTEMNADGGVLAFHQAHAANNPKTGFELCMVADRPLEEVQAQLSDAGFDPGRIVDEDFGRSLRVTDPDGNELQINE